MQYRNSKQKFLRNVAEEKDINPGKSIYIDISSQQKPSYGGSKNWIIIQYSDTEQKLSFFANTKEYFTEKFTPSLKKRNTTKEGVKICRCDNADENKTLEENCAEKNKEINF